ncbi:MAG: glyoxylate/hydroxypyruvate reductase A [Alphaproteobacteria bacterium]|nr:glyoxylate/hydroxypyruvate reductase A [Alphaproteobacteria bacterium]
MALLFKSDIDRGDSWRRVLLELEPGLDLREWPEIGDPNDIEYALVWKPPQGELKTYPNLKAIFSLGAGIDHLASDPELPKDVPVVRMVEPGLTAGMTEFVIMSVLYHHRFMLDYAAQARAHQWREIDQVPAWERRVGIMGLGVLGGDAAEALVGLRFDVAGWSGSPKNLPGVTSFHGADGFLPFLNRSDILVCLLPLTPETEGILDASAFAALPSGAALINAARGGHVVEADLLAALDSGALGAATLDVFDTEPLPQGHPFWAHPRVRVTPHVAAITYGDTTAREIALNIKRFRAGAPMSGLVDRRRHY